MENNEKSSDYTMIGTTWTFLDHIDSQKRRTVSNLNYRSPASNMYNSIGLSWKMKVNGKNTHYVICPNSTFIFSFVMVIFPSSSQKK